jgi:60 kDa SS-A/Ro ribonucleoprotein
MEKAPTQAMQKLAEISAQGRAVKQSPTLFMLALAASSKNKDLRKHALGSIAKVVLRTGSHWLEFLANLKQLRSAGRLVRRAAQRWYNKENMPYQVLKYQNRHGFTQRDALRLTRVATLRR